MRTAPTSWFRRPQRLLLVFAAVTLLPAAGLIWLGSALISQDREVAENQLRDRLETQANIIVSEIARDLARPSTATIAAGTPADDPRALALLIKARDANAAGRNDEALAIWERMKDMDTVHAFGWPASLSAATARVRELGLRKQTTARDAEAAAIRADLSRGRWRIDGATLEAAWNDVANVKTLGASWQDRWEKTGAAVHMSDAAGETLLESGTLTGPVTTRSTIDSGLPWTIRVASRSPEADLRALASRRRDLLLVLCLAGFLAVAGAYFVARGVRRELAVAELQSKFVSAVSYEFRTPLTSMSHLIELLRGRPDIDHVRRARYYDALEQEASRLRRFVDQLLDFGRVDAGAVRYKLEVTDLRAVVEIVVGRFRESAGARGHRVTLSSGAGHVAVAAVDTEAFALVLNNLLENAAKYSPVGSAIDVSVTTGQDRRVQVRVSDQGAGIPKAEHQLIFEKFVRGSAAEASHVRGTGVGLALAREIVRGHGGDISVESDVGRGSAFTISLPPVAEASLDEPLRAGAGAQG